MRLFEFLKFYESKQYTLHLSKKYKKAVVKYSNKPSNIKLLKSLINTLEDEGEITSNNMHVLQMPVKSDITGKMEKGWRTVWISRSDDLRLGYKRFPDGQIEVRFGTADDIGYKH